MILRKVADYFDRFWFAPSAVISLSVFRIFIGLLLLQWVWLMLPDALVWYGPKGIVSQAALQQLSVYITFNLLNCLPASELSVYAIFGLLALTAICLILGWKIRIAAALAFICLLTLYNRDPLNLNSGDTYLRQILFWLIFVPPVQAFSLDKWLADRCSHTGPYAPLAAPWTKRMLQLQMCLLYCHSFFCKAASPAWFDGTAIYYACHLTEFQKLPLPYIFDNITNLRLLDWTTLLIEYALFTYIWVKPLTYPVIAVAVLFHLIIDWSLNIPQFEWLMIASFILFVDDKDILALIDTARKSLLKCGKLISYLFSFSSARA